jgi:hypothetical protein
MPITSDRSPIPLHKSRTMQVLFGLGISAILSTAPDIKQAIDSSKFTQRQFNLICFNVGVAFLTGLGAYFRIKDTQPVYTHDRLPGPNKSDYLTGEERVPPEN